MGTRSTIALEYADGTVEQVYCHWDGYVEHNGKILVEHYMDPFKVQQLVMLGGFSSLCATVEETAKTAYTRRGDDLTIESFGDVISYENGVQLEEFNYILRRDGKWYMAIEDGIYTNLAAYMAFVSIKDKDLL